MDLRTAVQDYLSHVVMLELGTSKDNKSWVTTVYFSYDMNLNIYWLSDPEKRHSQEIAKNSHVSGAFVIPHNYGEKVRGLRFEGKAKLLEGNESESGIMVYKSRFWVVEDRAKGRNGQAIFCYQAIPEKYYLYDEINFPDNPSQILQV